MLAKVMRMLVIAMVLEIVMVLMMVTMVLVFSDGDKKQ